MADLWCLSATSCHPLPDGVKRRWWKRYPQPSHTCSLRRGHDGYHFTEFTTALGIGYVVRWISGADHEPRSTDG